MRLRWLQPSLADLEAIGDLISRQSPGAATRLTGHIVHAAENLSDLPGLGRPGRVIGTRELVVPATSSIIVYRVRGEAVELLAIIHAARQWPEHFE